MVKWFCFAIVKWLFVVLQISLQPFNHKTLEKTIPNFQTENSG